MHIFSKKQFSFIDPSQFTFHRRLFLLSPMARSLVRIISSIFLIVWWGATIAFLLSDVSRIQWFGMLLFCFFLDYIVHIRRAHYTLDELYAGQVPQNNVALCMNRKTLRLTLSALERTETRGGDLWCWLAHQLAVTRHPIRVIIERLDISFDEFIRELSQEYEKTKTAPQASAPTSTMAPHEYRAQLTDRIGVVCIEAVQIARMLRKPIVDEESFFAALMNISHPRITKILDLFHITGSDISEAVAFGGFISRSSIPASLSGFAQAQSRVHAHRVNRTLTSRPTPTLDEFSEDITEYARMGLEGFLIGHEDEYRRMVDMLSGSTNRNVLLVGEQGVGKESLLYHLAFEIISDSVPGSLFDRRVVSLSLSQLIAGASAEDVSGRLSRVADEILRAGNIILYISDVHVLAQPQIGGVLLVDILMPILRNNIFPVVGSTYPREEKEYIQSNTAISGLFQSIRIQELSVSDTVRLLSYDALVMEKKHKVTIYFSAIRQAAVLAAKYLHAKPLPSSAQELLAEVISGILQRGERVVKGSDVIATVERRVQIPIHAVSGIEAEKLLHLEDEIHKHFIDQEEAVTAVSQALRQYRSGLSRSGGPIASFLFVGPTGVGKTELSKLLAKINFGSDSLMARFDMSEYQQKESITRFIGSPDGRVSGSLTEAVLAHPYSLVLLDELEKAHPDILNLFLQVLDDGRLTDSLGRVVDFQNTIIIATSNAHSVFIQERIQAGEHVSQFGDTLKKKLTELFKPEFLNRFSDIVVFRPLAQEHIEQIARLNLATLQKLLQETNGIQMEISDAAVHRIAELGYDPSFGARPLRKVIDNSLKAVFAQKILSGEIHRGATIQVDIDAQGTFVFQ
ncbi:MAG: ATP-dependent Clp protease ATP-binding subunit [Candidatus Paceibacterota bacterium]